MVKNSIVSRSVGARRPKQKGPESLALGPGSETKGAQEALGRFIWQLVGVLDT